MNQKVIGFATLVEQKRKLNPCFLHSKKEIFTYKFNTNVRILSRVNGSTRFPSSGWLVGGFSTSIFESFSLPSAILIFLRNRKALWSIDREPRNAICGLFIYLFFISFVGLFLFIEFFDLKPFLFSTKKAKYLPFVQLCSTKGQNIDNIILLTHAKSCGG